MPELPEVETVRRGLTPRVSGSTVVGTTPNRPNLRFPFAVDLAQRLQGRRVQGITRRSKYLVFEFDEGVRLLSHLGMTGTWRFEEPTEDDPDRYGEVLKHDHLSFEMEDAKGSRYHLVYNDARRFGFVDLFDDMSPSRFLRDLGPEPLEHGFDAAVLRHRLGTGTSPIKTALLNQTVVAGLGNIYVCEALFMAGISPLRPAGSLSMKEAKALVLAIRSVLREALAAGGSTLKDYRNADGGKGAFQDKFAVYGRAGKPCVTPGCGALVEKVVQATRTTFFCPQCQAPASVQALKEAVRAADRVL